MAESDPQTVRTEDDDETEVSPEPSPSMNIPAPQLPPSAARRQPQSARPYWTPRTHRGEQRGDYEDDSIPPFPEAPSPYSPPPASLFSGEEWPAKIVRKRRPLEEIRTSPPSSASNDTLDSTDLSLEQRLSHPVGLELAPTAYTPSVSGRSSHVLPAVVHLKTDLQESHQSLYLLQQENKALAQECDRFQSQLVKWRQAAKQERAANEKERESLQSQVQRLTAANQAFDQEKEELEHRIDRLETLEKEIKAAGTEKERLQAELDEAKKEGNQAQLEARGHETDKQALASELLATKSHRDTLEAERKELLDKAQLLESEIRDMRSKLKEQSAEAAKRMRATREELEAAEQILKQENTSLKLEMDRLKAMLKESEKRNARRGETSEKISEMQDEIGRLEASLQKAVAKSNELRAQKTALRKELADKNRPRSEIACQTDPLPCTGKSEISTQTEVLPGLEHSVPTSSTTAANRVAWTGDSITQRLGRIRDAAERAALGQEYRRELARITKDRDNEIKRLAESHDDNISEVLKDATEEVNARVKEHKKRLQKEYDAKIDELEKKHKDELKRVQQEYDKSAAVAEEVMQAAIAEASSASEQLQREVSTRKKLDDTVRELELERQASLEKKAQSEEVQQQEWETKVKEILDGIQDECNAIFDRNKTSRSRNVSSIMRRRAPSATVEPIVQPKVSFDLDELLIPPTAALNQSLVSTPSQIDRALEETEALILSLVGNDLRV